MAPLYARIAGGSETNDLSFDGPLRATTPAPMDFLEATRDTRPGSVHEPVMSRLHGRYPTLSFSVTKSIL